MLLTPLLVLVSGYSLIFNPGPCVHEASCFIGKIDSELQDTINHWVVGGIVATLASILFLLLRGQRAVIATSIGFAALVYWSGFFAPFFYAFLLPNLAWFALPPFIAVLGVMLTWASEVKGKLPPEFWLSLSGGFLMVVYSFPRLVITWGDIRGLSSPPMFLVVSSMIVGAILTLLSSLALALESSDAIPRQKAPLLSTVGLVYYWLGLAELVVSANPLLGDLSTIHVFFTIGLLLSIPALSARVLILKGNRRRGIG